MQGTEEGTGGERNLAAAANIATAAAAATAAASTTAATSAAAAAAAVSSASTGAATAGAARVASSRTKTTEHFRGGNASSNSWQVEELCGIMSSNSWQQSLKNAGLITTTANRPRRVITDAMVNRFFHATGMRKLLCLTFTLSVKLWKVASDLKDAIGAQADEGSRDWKFVCPSELYDNNWALAWLATTQEPMEEAVADRTCLFPSKHSMVRAKMPSKRLALVVAYSLSPFWVQVVNTFFERGPERVTSDSGVESDYASLIDAGLGCDNGAPAGVDGPTALATASPHPAASLLGPAWGVPLLPVAILAPRDAATMPPIGGVTATKVRGKPAALPLPTDATPPRFGDAPVGAGGGTPTALPTPTVATPPKFGGAPEGAGGGTPAALPPPTVATPPQFGGALERAGGGTPTALPTPTVATPPRFGGASEGAGGGTPAALPPPMVATPTRFGGTPAGAGGVTLTAAGGGVTISSRATGVSAASILAGRRVNPNGGDEVAAVAFRQRTLVGDA